MYYLSVIEEFCCLRILQLICYVGLRCYDTGYVLISYRRFGEPSIVGDPITACETTCRQCNVWKMNFLLDVKLE
jgi:hypothetical protein